MALVRWVVILLAFVTAPSVNVEAQTAADAHAKCSISGTVADVFTGRPLSSVHLFAEVVSQGEEAPAEPATSVSDATGGFMIADLPPGRYVLRAEREGYSNQPRASKLGSEIVALAPGQQLKDFVVALTPMGTIEGHITNDSGMTITGVFVQAMKQVCNNNGCELEEVASATSGRSGAYRLTGLAPGRYLVRAITPEALTAETGKDSTFVPLYYPGSSSASAATQLVVHPGDTFTGIDMTLVPVPTVHVRGQVIDGRNGEKCSAAELTLLSDHGTTFFATGQIKSDSDGRFDLAHIPPGAYVVVGQMSAQNPRGVSLWGHMAVEVTDENVDGVKLALSSGVSVSGNIRFEGKPGLDPGELTVTLEAAEDSTLNTLMPAVEESSVRPDGSFVLRNVLEGRYAVHVSPVPPDYYQESGRGEENWMEVVNIVGGRPAPPLEIVLRPGAASVEGAVSDDKPAAGAFLVLVPEGQRRQQAQFYKTSVSNRLGRFALRGVVPGDYKLFAWDQVEGGEYLNPDFLAPYEDRGQPLHIDAGDHAQVQVQLISRSESR